MYSDPIQAISNDVIIKNKVIDEGGILQVNIKNSSYLRTYMDRLVWYYNEYPIFSTNIQLLEQGQSFNASFQNGGEYRVRYEGLLTVPNSKKCEHLMLKALQYYPIFQPAVFNSRKKGITDTLSLPLHYLYFF